MDYLKRLGITRSEGQIANLLVNPNAGVDEYDDNLNAHHFTHFLSAFSMDRDEYMTDRFSGGNQKEFPGFYGINKVLRLMMFPQADVGIVKRRQDLVKYFIEMFENNPRVIGAMTQALESHNNLDNLCFGEGGKRKEPDISSAGKVFAPLVNSLLTLEEQLSRSPLTQDFSMRIRGLVEENAITNYAYLLDEGGQLVIDSTKGFYLARKMPLRGAIELGLIENKGIKEDRYSERKSGRPIGVLYPGENHDVEKIAEFTHESAPLVYLLGSAFLQANAYRQLKKLGKPVCFPKINTNGEFEIRKAWPVGTYVERYDSVVPVDFWYKQDDKHILLSGAHSGGKTEILRNIGLYHLLGLAGMIVPARIARIPVTKRIITSFKKEKQEGKGSLESEMAEAVRLERELQEGDLALIDEFLDTTKPELARHLSEPLLQGEKDLFRGFAHSPAAVIIIDHRASRMPDNIGFRFMYPELKEFNFERDAKKRGYHNPDLVVKTGLVPTRRFLVGKPNPELTRAHAKQMWQRIVGEMNRGNEDY